MRAPIRDRLTYANVMATAALFIALGGGVGFHGTADLASIGQAASHGCIRMRIPDVISLYNRTPIGTPVRIR